MSPPSALLAALAAAAATLAAVPAAASWRYQADLFARHNPKGGAAALGADYRRVYGAGGGPLLEGRYLQGGGRVALTPAYGQTSLHAEWSPLAVLQLRLQGDLYGYFGANDGLLSFPSAGAPYEDGAREALSGREQSRLGQRLLLRPVVALRLGPWTLRNQVDLARYWLHGGGPFLLELEQDVLLARADNVVLERVQVFHAWRRFLAGPQFELLAAEGSGLRRARLAGVAVAELRPWRRFRPRVAAEAGLHLQDPNRRGQLYVQLSGGADWGRE